MTEKNKRRGAPEKPENEKRTERLGVVQLTKNELNSYVDSAELEDKNKSDWVRDTLNAQVQRTLKKK